MILLFQPETLLGASFQMSFAAVFALVVVFDRLGPLTGLAAADALPAAARAVAVDALDVVQVLVRDSRWTRLLDAARTAETARLEAALGRLAAPAAGSAMSSSCTSPVGRAHCWSPTPPC